MNKFELIGTKLAGAGGIAGAGYVNVTLDAALDMG